MDIKLRDLFRITESEIGFIGEVFGNGFNYHTLNKKGDCIKGQQYMLKTDFEADKSLNLV